MRADHGTVDRGDFMPRKPRAASLTRMFSLIASDYDFLNHLLTFGMDCRWRRHAARSCLESSPPNILDLCCGTGESLLSVLRDSDGEAKVIGVDFSKSMIGEARLKAGVRGHLLMADAAHLPFRDGSFDCIGTAFSFRNLLYKNPAFSRYISEVIRVLRHGGSFVILETSQPENPLVRRIYHAYLRRVIPFLGGVVSRNRAAYAYLSKSALSFPASEEITSMLLRAGFTEVAFQPLSLGSVGIHTARK